jgi:hypothetical protein
MLPGGHAPLHMQHRIHRRLSHPRHVLTVWEPRPVQPDPAREKSPDEVRLQGPREPYKTVDLYAGRGTRGSRGPCSKTPPEKNPLTK